MYSKTNHQKESASLTFMTYLHKTCVHFTSAKELSRSASRLRSSKGAEQSESPLLLSTSSTSSRHAAPSQAKPAKGKGKGRTGVGNDHDHNDSDFKLHDLRFDFLVSISCTSNEASSCLQPPIHPSGTNHIGATLCVL